MLPFKLGITGSIGMGKTQTAKFFFQEGIPVWDADKTVHKLYKKGEDGYDAIKKFSNLYVNTYEVDRKKILKESLKQKDLLSKIESKIHPLLKKNRNEFIDKNKHHPIITFDIPLLFETGERGWLDGVLVVKTNPIEQERRVLKRGTMTKEQFQKINSKQINIEEKCQLADFIIETDLGLRHVKTEVKKIIQTILKKNVKN